MSMILFVLSDADKLGDLLDAWQAAGAGGVTVFKSTGIGRISQEQALRDDLPLLPSIEDFYPNPERMGRTLFTIVDEDRVAAIVDATQQVVGDLSEPDTGLLVVLPTSAVYGLKKKKS